jgi:signal transduction histidine kinase
MSPTLTSAAPAEARRTLSPSVAYGLAASVVGLAIFASATSSPLSGTYQELWGFSPLVLTLIYAFGVVASLLLAGSVSDRVGRRPVLVLAFGAIVTTGLLIAADSVAWLFAARGLQGIATGLALAVTAIANAECRAELTASRALVVAAAEGARRRVVRDLHDGAQHGLVQTVISLKIAQHALHQNEPNAEGLLENALRHAEQATADVRELAHGILPAGLTRGGLRGAVDSLVSQLNVPVDTEVSAERVPAEIAAGAYFVVAEALTNVVKHAHASRAGVKAWTDAGTLHVEVRDDGVGGARADGTGLVGLADRVAALEGRLRVESLPEGGTLIAATLPVEAWRIGPLADRAPAR